MPKIESNVTVEGSGSAVTRSPLGLDDFQSNYLKVPIGEYEQLTIAKLEKVQGGDPKFHLKGVDYKVEITSSAGFILSVNAWGLWNEIKRALHGVGKVEGVVLRIEHPAEGIYKVSVIGKPLGA